MKRVVLCRPEGPRNVGMALRACLNFGPCELHLVAPARPSMLVHPEFVQMSHGADEARAAIVVTRTLEESLTDVARSVGFTARVRGHRVRRDWRGLAPELRGAGAAPDERLALVFGSEESGLTRAESALCQELAHVRTSAEHTSLNLAMAVTVALADLFSGQGPAPREPGGRALNGDGRAFLKARMKEVFGGRIARNAEAAKLIEASIERVFSRATLENRDAKAWHLMLNVLGSNLRPDELGLVPHTKGGRRRQLREKRERGGGDAGAE